ncbi:transcription factor IIIA-like [Zingiber officinale]|uniref:transcription factor IIIA-like n=1 Tax=Zingiber officinale TaxID=94328 RepID=UPI001C4C66F5|nr:transcription factor IIIA-like [Zingiber officinale]
MLAFVYILEYVEVVSNEPGCMKTFTNVECLKAHIKTSHLYVDCVICGTKQLKKNIKRHEHMHEASEVTERTKCNFEGCERTFSNVSNLRQHIKAVHQNLRPFACRFSECGKKFPYKHVRDNHEKSGVHSYIQGDFLEIDEQWQSRPRGGRKRKCPSIGSFCRKRIVSPEQASTLMYNVLRNMMQAEFCWWDEIEQVIVFVQAEFRFPFYPTLFLASNLSFVQAEFCF